MSFTNFLEANLLDHVFGGRTYTPPATLYIGLSSTAPTDDGLGVTEPTTGGYARVPIDNSGTSSVWNVDGADGTKTNAEVITFPAATADWGAAITHFFIADSATGGVLAYGNLGVAKTIGIGDTASFGAGSLTITLD